MTNKQLYNFVQRGYAPIVRVAVDNVTDGSIWDKNMIGKIEYAKLYDQGTENEHISFGIREDIFREKNTQYMKANYYDDMKDPTLTYIQAGMAPSLGVDEVFVMSTDTDFVMVNEEGEENKLLIQFMNSDFESYTEYLEHRVNNPKMPETKESRWEHNPEEQLFVEEFLRQFQNPERTMSYIIYGSSSSLGNPPKDFVDEYTKQVFINTIQWLGSPVGRGFLKDLGYKKQGI